MNFCLRFRFETQRFVRAQRALRLHRYRLRRREDKRTGNEREQSRDDRQTHWTHRVAWNVWETVDAYCRRTSSHCSETMRVRMCRSFSSPTLSLFARLSLSLFFFLSSFLSHSLSFTLSTVGTWSALRARGLRRRRWYEKRSVALQRNECRRCSSLFPPLDLCTAAIRIQGTI